MVDDNLRRGGIYRILNLANGRLYVGSTKQFARRWKAHTDCLKAGKHHSISLQRAWLKYSPKGFSFEVIEYLADFSLLLPREQFWIDELKAADRRLGYNISPTAGSCLGVVHGPETRAKISLRFKGKPKTPEHRAKIGASHRARGPRGPYGPYLRSGKPRKRWFHSASTRQKMSVSANARWAKGGVSEETRRKISANMAGRPVKESTREKCRLANLGKIVLPETGQKIAEANRRRKSAAILFDVTRKRGLSSPNQKIPPQAFADIILAYRNGAKMADLAQIYGVNRSSISRLISGSTHAGLVDQSSRRSPQSTIPGLEPLFAQTKGKAAGKPDFPKRVKPCASMPRSQKSTSRTTAQSAFLELLLLSA